MALYNILKFIYQHPLCQGEKKLKSILRFFRWQLATRALNLPVLVPFVNDTQLISERGIVCGSGAYYVGLFEFKEMAFTAHYLRSEDLFIDVGANVGTFTVLAAGVVGARCVSVEPIPESYKRLVTNIDINCLKERVLALNVGLGESINNLIFTSDLDAKNHVATGTNMSEKIIQVEVTTLDSIADDKVPEMIKVDVEGYESKVVLGARKLLSGVNGPNVVLLELRGNGVKYGFNEKEVHEKMLKYGYMPYIYDPIYRTLHIWKPQKEDALGDMLYIRDVEKAKWRTREAQTFCVLDQRI